MLVDLVADDDFDAVGRVFDAVSDSLIDVQPRRGHPLTRAGRLPAARTRAGLDPRRALQDERRRTRARLADLSGDHAGIVEASRDSNADDEHDPRGRRSPSSAPGPTLVRQAEGHLAEVDAALGRLDAGDYGTCERCGRAIAPARLEARRSPDLRRLLSRRRTLGAVRDGQSRVSRRCVTRCGRAASTPSRSTLFAS